MAKRLAIFPTLLQSAVACFVLLASLAASAQQHEVPPSEIRAGADDAQDWERARGLTDEFLVQLAMARGLDPARAEHLRDLYQEQRSTRRRDIVEAEAGRMTRQELRLASARARARLDEQIGALLTPTEIVALDEDEARVQAVTSLTRIGAVDGSAPLSAVRDDCAIADASYRPVGPEAAGDWSVEFALGTGEKTMARVSGPFETSPVELDAMLFDVRGGATYRVGDALAIFFDERLVSVSPMRSAPAYMFIYGLGSELAAAPVMHRNVGLGDPLWRRAECRIGP